MHAHCNMIMNHTKFIRVSLILAVANGLFGAPLYDAFSAEICENRNDNLFASFDLLREYSVYPHAGLFDYAVAHLDHEGLHEIFTPPASAPTTHQTRDRIKDPTFDPIKDRTRGKESSTADAYESTAEATADLTVDPKRDPTSHLNRDRTKDPARALAEDPNKKPTKDRTIDTVRGQTKDTAHDPTADPIETPPESPLTPGYDLPDEYNLDTIFLVDYSDVMTAVVPGSFNVNGNDNHGNKCDKPRNVFAADIFTKFKGEDTVPYFNEPANQLQDEANKEDEDSSEEETEDYSAQQYESQYRYLSSWPLLTPLLFITSVHQSTFLYLALFVSLSDAQDFSNTQIENVQYSFAPTPQPTPTNYPSEVAASAAFGTVLAIGISIAVVLAILVAIAMKYGLKDLYKKHKDNIVVMQIIHKSVAQLFLFFGSFFSSIILVSGSNSDSDSGLTLNTTDKGLLIIILSSIDITILVGKNIYGIYSNHKKEEEEKESGVCFLLTQYYHAIASLAEEGWDIIIASLLIKGWDLTSFISSVEGNQEDLYDTTYLIVDLIVTTSFIGAFIELWQLISLIASHCIGKLQVTYGVDIAVAIVWCSYMAFLCIYGAELAIQGIDDDDPYVLPSTRSTFEAGAAFGDWLIALIIIPWGVLMCYFGIKRVKGKSSVTSVN